METFGLFLTIAAAGTWVGAILFHSAVVAPATFEVLDTTAAGSFLRRLFPTFFRFGLACGALMLVGLLLAAGRGPSFTSPPVALTIAMCALQAVCLRMVPAINVARDLGEEGRQKFGRLHGVNVLLTLAVLVMGLVVIFLLTSPVAPGL